MSSPGDEPASPGTELQSPVRQERESRRLSQARNNEMKRLLTVQGGSSDNDFITEEAKKRLSERNTANFGSTPGIRFLDSDMRENTQTMDLVVAQLSENRADAVNTAEVFEFEDVKLEDDSPVADRKVEDEDAGEVDHPEYGCQRTDYDLQGYQKRREEAKAKTRFVPLLFSRRKLRSPSEFDPSEKVMALKDLKSVQPHNITLLSVENQNISKKIRRELGRLISHLSNLEVLVLRQMKLRRLDGLRLPRLLYADLSLNSISDPHTLVDTFHPSHDIDTLDVRGNPVIGKADLVARVIIGLTTVRMLNGCAITMEERSRAFTKHANSKERKKVPQLEWNSRICDIPAVQELRREGTTFDSSRLVELDMCNMNLSDFNVHGLLALRVLKLSHNRISVLAGRGLETCDALEVLHLDRNAISDVGQLQCLGLAPRLRSLTLAGNRLKKYRLAAIWHTRFCIGTNNAPGLVELDHVAVSLEERMSAWESFTRLKRKNAAGEERWIMTLIEVFGHRQLSGESHFLENVRALRLGGKGLSYVDVAGMPRLALLDVSDNAPGLRRIRGLESLGELAHFDARGNAKLDIDATLDALEDMRSLQSVHLAHDHKQGDALRERILKRLLKTNPNLRVINSKPITIAERVSFYRGSMSDDKLRTYAFTLGVELNVIAHTDPRRRYDPQEVLGGSLVSPSEVDTLPQMCHLGVGDGVSFAAYTNLIHLNFAHNHVTDITALGLDGLQQLRSLDLRHNRIANDPKTIGGVLNRLVQLQVVALEGNPCMRNDQDRRRILSSIERTHETTCPLRFFDRQITIDERLDAVQSSRGADGMTERERASLRWDIARSLRVPAHLRDDEVLGLDLRNLQLSHIEVGQYAHVRVLLAKDNALTSLDGLGIESLRELRVLDLRNNHLSDLAEAARVVSELPHLESLGLAGNKFKHNRAAVIAHLPALREASCSLRYLDEEEISVDDIVTGWSRHSGERKVDFDRFRFNVALFRRVPKNAPVASLTELDLSGCGLRVFDVTRFTALQRLSLAGNAIGNKELSESGLQGLQYLEELDVRHNKLTNITLLGTAISKLASLRSLLCTSNGCFQKDAHDARVKLLAKTPSACKWNSALSVLNGKLITVEERVEAAESSGIDASHVNELRITLYMKEQGVTEDVRSVDLSGKKLRGLNGIERFPHLENVDLSNNALTSLNVGDTCPLKHLPRLRFLDISKNRFTSVEHIVDALGACHQLRTVNMLLSTADRKLTRKPERYVNYVCGSLRGLDTCDSRPNPTPLDERQWEAVKFLYELAEVGPNRLSNVDLSGRKLHVEQLLPTLGALHYLPVQELRMDNNPWVKHPQHRILAIHEIRTLQFLDGARISTNERANAEKMVKEMKKSGDYESPELRDLSTAKASNATNGQKIAHIQNSLQQGLFRASGTLMTKFEIMTTFFQQYALYLRFPALENSFPSFLNDLSISLIPLFALEFDMYMPEVEFEFWPYVKFFGLMLLPAIFVYMYRSKMNQDRWISRYVEHVKRTLFLSLFKLAMMVAVLFAIIVGAEEVFTNGTCPTSAECANSSCDLGGCTTLERWNEHSTGPSSEVQGWMSAVLAPMMFLYGCYLIFVYIFHKKHKSMTFWYTLVKLKKRLALFFITIVYMPMAKAIIGALTAKKCGVPFNYESFKNNATYSGYELDAFCLTECLMSPDFLVTYTAGSVSGDFPSINDTTRTISWGAQFSNCPTVISGFETVVYPTNSDKFDLGEHWIMIAALGFAFVYLLGIPLFLTRLIRKGVNEINQNFLKHDNEVISKLEHRIAVAKEELSRSKQATEIEPSEVSEDEESRRRSLGHADNVQALESNIAQLKKDLEKWKKERNEAYGQSVRSYDSAQTYLYIPYKEKWKFYKIENLYEKFILTAVAAFTSAAFISVFDSSFGGEQWEKMLQTICTLSLFFVFLLVSVIVRPYFDFLENSMEIMCRLTNLLNLLFALLINFPWKFATLTSKNPCGGYTSAPSGVYPLNGMTDSSVWDQYCRVGNAYAESWTESQWQTFLSDGDHHAPFEAWVNTALAILNVSCLAVIAFAFFGMPIRHWMARRRYRRRLAQREGGKDSREDILEELYESEEEERELEKEQQRMMEIIREQTAAKSY